MNTFRLDHLPSIMMHYLPNYFPTISSECEQIVRIRNTMKRNQHVVPHPQGWAVKAAGATNPTKVLGTQRAAIETARGIAVNQGSEMFVHGRNGQIRERNTYGPDNCPPKG